MNHQSWATKYQSSIINHQNMLPRVMALCVSPVCCAGCYRIPLCGVQASRHKLCAKVVLARAGPWTLRPQWSECHNGTGGDPRHPWAPCERIEEEDWEAHTKPRPTRRAVASRSGRWLVQVIEEKASRNRTRTKKLKRMRGLVWAELWSAQVPWEVTWSRLCRELAEERRAAPRTNGTIDLQKIK